MSKIYLYDKNLNLEIKELLTLSTPDPSCKSPKWPDKGLGEFVSDIKDVIDEANKAKVSVNQTLDEFEKENPEFYKFLDGEFHRLEKERQGFVTEQKKGLERITIYLNKGVGNSEKIGGDYDCRLDAMAAIKDHALNSGREQIYGLCVNDLMTHFVKSNGYHFEIWDLPINMQTRMEKIDDE